MSSLVALPGVRRKRPSRPDDTIRPQSSLATLSPPDPASRVPSHSVKSSKPEGSQEYGCVQSAGAVIWGVRIKAVGMRRGGMPSIGGCATTRAAAAGGTAKPMGAPLPAGVKADARIWRGRGLVRHRSRVALLESRLQPVRMVAPRLKGGTPTRPSKREGPSVAREGRSSPAADHGSSDRPSGTRRGRRVPGGSTADRSRRA
jgi:hypothetical protein